MVRKCWNFVGFCGMIKCIEILIFVWEEWNMDFNSNKRPENMERITNFDLANAFIEEQVAAVRGKTAAEIKA